MKIAKNSEIGILGVGVEGACLAKYLNNHGYNNVTLLDEKQDLNGFKNEFKIIKGSEAFQNLENFDYIFRSPGIHKDKRELEKARRKGTKVTSATKFFFDLCPCEIVGITGTKGKGTTSTLIYTMLKNAGKDVYLGGNIGECPLNFLDKLKKSSVVVLELSSFQLHDLEKSPHVAVIVKTTSEHLDYHKDLEEYLSAKESIVMYQKKTDAVIANIDFPYHLRYVLRTPAKKYLVSSTKQPENGAYVKDGIVYIVEKGEKTEICKTNEVGLIGPHNIENILAAAAACVFLKIEVKHIARAAKEFKGLPHRLEFIKRVNGVSFYNDSFSTTPETCIAAIKSFTEPEVLIAGGSEKFSDYSDLGFAIADSKNLKAVVLMGITGPKIEKEINKAFENGAKRETPLKIVMAVNYKEAFMAAYLEASGEGVVLLSPASASFDQFENYKKRGDAFRNWVESL